MAVQQYDFRFGVVSAIAKTLTPVLETDVALAKERAWQAYFDVDYSSHDYRLPWATLFSFTNPGFVNVNPGTGGAPAAATADGRVAVVPDPAGGGGYCSRHEIRDSDSGWPSNTTLDKAEVRTLAEYTFDRVGGAVEGDVRWFSTSCYMPYNDPGEKFEWATGGGNNFTDIMELHSGSSGQFSAISMSWYPGTPQYARFRVFGGDYANPPAVTNINLWQITDSGGNRVMANHNRWIAIDWGIRFADDASGWFEVWVDGVNVLPLWNHATMWTADPAMYFKQGQYKEAASVFPSGVSVLYWGRTRIGYTKPHWLV
jgi:Polysaccharide lyase